MTPQRLGPYKLGDVLGKGGMGTVYRATHVETGDAAAVKALGPHLAAAEGFRDRFESEIESLKLLRHPGIVRLIGYGEEEGTLFYAMELVDGTSLEEELCAGRRFNWREVTDYGIQICRALKHAHDHGVVHRDIKPANLLVNSDGQVKIADFGIARLFGATQLTSAGGVLGTADYMSPEQADGKHITESCDQYSLGGVMYALLAGRPPFRAKSLPEMLQLQRFAEPEPVRRFASETPKQLEHLIDQLLAKDAANRFPNVLVLARHMEAMRRALSRPAPDDFSLATDQAPHAVVPPDAYPSVSMHTTRIEPGAVLGESIDLPPIPEQADTPPQQSLGANESARPRKPSASDRSGTDSVDLEIEPPEVRADADSSHAVTTARRNKASVKRFTTVEDDQSPSHSTSVAQKWLLAAQVTTLAMAIALVGLAMWYFSRPVTADELYATISNAAASGKEERLWTAEDEIDQFLQQFPDDERAGEVASWKEGIALSRLESRLRKRASTPKGAASLAPIEQMYVDAVRWADTEPYQAMEELRMILVIYPAKDEFDQAEPSDRDGSADTDNEQEENKRVEDCRRLITRKLKRLSDYVAKEANNQSPFIQRRLDAADELCDENPQLALEIYEAVIRLFQEKPWAAEFVAHARKAISEISGEVVAND